MIPELWRNSKSAITDGVSDTSLFLGAVLPSPLFVIANVSVVGIIMGALTFLTLKNGTSAFSLKCTTLQSVLNLILFILFAIKRFKETTIISIKKIWRGNLIKIPGLLT